MITPDDKADMEVFEELLSNLLTEGKEKGLEDELVLIFLINSGFWLLYKGFNYDLCKRLFLYKEAELLIAQEEAKNDNNKESSSRNV